jgi:hypothetical protein
MHSGNDRSESATYYLISERCGEVSIKTLSYRCNRVKGWTISGAAAKTITAAMPGRVAVSRRVWAPGSTEVRFL